MATEKKRKKIMPKMEIVATKEEIDQALKMLTADYYEMAKEADKNEPNAERIKTILRRQRGNFVSKNTTLLYQVEDMFFAEQKGRGNSAATIQYYQRVFKKLYLFLAYATTADAEEYKKLLALNGEGDVNAEVEFGSLLPLITLEMDNIVAEFREYLTETEELGEQTVKSYLTGFRVIMYFYMEKGWIDKHDITIKDVAPPLKQTYTETEIKKLLKKPNVDDFVDYRDWVITNWFLATGNRVSSVCEILVKDISLEEGYANINRQKNREPIQVPIVSKMRNILKEYIRYYRTDNDGKVLSNEYLFCNAYGGKLTEQGLKKTIARYNTDRGVQKTSCHLYRHTFCKQWIMSGGDMFSLQRMLGHKSLKMVSHYANIYKTDAAKKAEVYSALSQANTNGGRKLQRRK